MNSDSGLIDVFQLFSNHKNKSIMFEVAKKAYIPLPPKASTNIQNQHPRFIVDSQNIEFNEFENNLFHYKGDNEDAQGDNEDGHSVSSDSEEVFKVDSDKARGSVDKDELGLGDRSEIPVAGVDEAEQNINLELFEGVDNEPPEITYTSTPADITLYERWERCNRLSVMFIKTKISDGIRGSVDQHEKVWDLLKAIDDQFVTLEKALASTLIMKFSSLRLTSVKGVHEHIMQMRDITDLRLN
ncbi:hypothetical protein LWI29_011917 [Acer saccharum]|uniref:Uncharacterized protein n=1 Tax=Acer saccharum TaxID=4024 RepID=A0AA39SL22_ACESA|nr:hypothetical protein LWI29_011917 [Acer saccharum]